ncbi:endonuclease toxin domain-containing protein, partial [Sphingomonas pituitosa]|uniref:endonuclease toxin domain-containing protein n=1 Tax=Sphingomonas pituitosa TaxID=99597 RepID=UPI000A4B0237
PSKNSLTTGTLHASDLENRETWEASQTSIGGGIGGIKASKGGQASQQGATPLSGLPIKGIGTVTATPPMAMGASGDQSGTTQSAIANGTITITSGDAASAALAQTISRDTSGANAGAIVQQFDEAKRQEIAQGFQAAQTLAAETTAFLSSQASKAEQWAKENPNRDPQSNPYAIWGAGGAGRLVLTAINGAAGSDVAGSLTSLVQGAAVNVLQGLATSKVKEIADKLQSKEARAALQGLVGCAGSAAGGSGDCASGAMGAAAAVVLNDLLKTGKTTATDKDGKPLTLAEQQARDNLVATIVAAVASGAGLDAQSAVTSAHLETQNNSERMPDGSLKVILPRQVKYSIEQLIERDSTGFGAQVKKIADDQNVSVSDLLKSYGEYVACRASSSCVQENNPYLDKLAVSYGNAADAASRQDVAELVSKMKSVGLDEKQRKALLDKLESGQITSAAIESQIAAAYRGSKIAYLSGGSADLQSVLSRFSDAELASFQRNFDSLDDAGKAIVRSDLATIKNPGPMEQALGTVLNAIADPATLQDLYFLKVQDRANVSNGLAGATKEAAPAAQFLADLGTLSSVADPETGQLDPVYQTAEGQAVVKAAQDRINAQAKAAGGAATKTGLALLDFVAALTPPGDGDPFYVPTQAEADAYKARSAAARAAAMNATSSALNAVTAQTAPFFGSCVFGSNADSGACGGAAAELTINGGVALATDGLVGRFASVGVKVETSVDAGIAWGKGIAGQGGPWEDYIAARLPVDDRLPPNFKTFDFFEKTTGRAISAKTLDTSTASRLSNPSQIYATLKSYADAVADFGGYKLSNVRLSPSDINVREIHLAIPSGTNTAQWEQIMKAAEYSRKIGVNIDVTVTK